MPDIRTPAGFVACSNPACRTRSRTTPAIAEALWSPDGRCHLCANPEEQKAVLEMLARDGRRETEEL